MRASFPCVRPVEAADRRIALGSDHGLSPSGRSRRRPRWRAGAGGSDDEQVIAAAAAEGRILVSADTNFGSPLPFRIVGLRAWWVLRLARRDLDGQAALLISALAEFEGRWASGSCESHAWTRARLTRGPVGTARLVVCDGPPGRLRRLKY